MTVYLKTEDWTQDALRFNNGGLWESPGGLWIKAAGVWKLSAAAVPALGDAFQGGFYGGMLDYPTIGRQAIIMAPQSSEVNRSWYTSSSHSPILTASGINGLADTQAAIATGDAGFSAAAYAASYAGGGFTDWAVPARYELELLYYNFKPTTDGNGGGEGGNPYSVPPRGTYTSGDPARTSLAAYQEGGAQAFDPDFAYLTSTEDASFHYAIDFFEGLRISASATLSARLRLIRRIPVVL